MGCCVDFAKASVVNHDVLGCQLVNHKVQQGREVCAIALELRQQNVGSVQQALVGLYVRGCIRVFDLIQDVLLKLKMLYSVCQQAFNSSADCFFVSAGAIQLQQVVDCRKQIAVLLINLLMPAFVSFAPLKAQCA